MRVLLFGGRRSPRALAALEAVTIADGALDTALAERALDTAIDVTLTDARRVAVVGTDADLAAVLTRLMRADLLDVEVAHVRGALSARRARTGTARRVPLVRDDTGTALAGAALWLPPNGRAALRGEAVADDTVLFDGEVPGVRIEPTAEMPGLRATVWGATVPGRRPRRWIAGRAVQLGTTGARVVRDGVPGSREVTRSTFYRHTTGWLRIG